jgi:putative polyketide hydroxylase
MGTAEVPVLIAGGGPAGLTMSLLLSRHGVASLLVEKHAGSSPLPRARGIHARAMEILRVAGVEDDLRAAALPIHPGVEWRANLATGPVREVSMSGSAAVEVSPCEGVSLAQDVLEKILRDHAAASDLAGLRHQTELRDLVVSDDRAEGVLLDRASGTTTRVRARYLIAADGARSGTRQHLGIGMDGSAEMGRQRAVYFRADLSAWTGPSPRGLYFISEVHGVLVWTHPDHRWVLNLRDSGGEEDPLLLIERAVGTRPRDVEMLGDSRWTAAAQNATSYRAGAAFLVGDAAHRFPPAGAAGISTAMHDTHNLAWKLAAVLHQRAGDALLDTYQQERQPVGARNAAETTSQWRQFTNRRPRYHRCATSVRSTWATSTTPTPSYPTAAPTPTRPEPPTPKPPYRAAARRTCGPTAAPPSTCSTATSSCLPDLTAPHGAQPWPEPLSSATS